jgi:hypothetical protein
LLPLASWYNFAKGGDDLMLSMDETTQTVRGVRLQTFKRTFEQILNGDEPWYPLSEFTHQWFGRYQDYRAELVREAIEVPESVSPEQFRWAVWCAASVEYLCKKYGQEVPAWVMDQRYQLLEPWYYDEIEGPEEEAELREETPEAFAWRNVYCEANPYRNKYEKPYRGDHHQERKSA